MSESTCELRQIIRERLTGQSNPEIIQHDLLAAGHPPAAVQLALGVERRRAALRGGVAAIAAGLVMASVAVGLMAAFRGAGRGSIALATFGAISVLVGVVRVVRGLFTAMRPPALSSAPRLAHQDRVTPPTVLAGTGRLPGHVDIEWLVEVSRIETRGRNRLLVGMGVGCCLLVFLLPVGLMLLWSARAASRKQLRFAELVRDRSPQVQWIYGKVNQTNLKSFAFAFLGLVDSRGRRRKLGVALPLGELERALFILAGIFPDAALGEGKAQRRAFADRAREQRLSA